MPINFLAGGCSADLYLTAARAKAAAEARSFGCVRIAASTAEARYRTVPQLDDIDLDPSARQRRGRRHRRRHVVVGKARPHPDGCRVGGNGRLAGHAPHQGRRQDIEHSDHRVDRPRAGERSGKERRGRLRGLRHQAGRSGPPSGQDPGLSGERHDRSRAISTTWRRGSSKALRGSSM